MKVDGLNSNTMVPRTMSKIPEDTATQDMDHLWFFLQQHRVSLLTGAALITNAAAELGSPLNTLLSESMGMGFFRSSKGTIVETVEGKEVEFGGPRRISILYSASAMIRLWGCLEAENVWDAGTTILAHGKGKYFSVLYAYRAQSFESLLTQFGGIMCSVEWKFQTKIFLSLKFSQITVCLTVDV